ncbi:MAG: acyltransferase [Clostridia bacterium]|nr:acyltransferase [Clostridia bacterium]
MKVGKDVTIMNGVIFGSEPYLITLGDRVRISSNVQFITHDGGTWAFRREPGYEGIVRFGKIVVGNDSFIGAHSVIMPGVTIGKNCVVGAGSIVTKDIPDRTVVAGVPAKVICTTDEYAKKCKERMPANFDMAKYKANKKAYLQEIL